MSRWAMQIDPDLAQAEESLAIFPTEKQLLTMVENRKRFRARSPEHWAQSCLNARRKSHEIGELYLTPEERAQLDAELYPHQSNKRRHNTNPLTPSRSIAADRQFNLVPDHEILTAWVEKETKRLAEVMQEKKNARQENNNPPADNMSQKKKADTPGLFPLLIEN